MSLDVFIDNLVQKRESLSLHSLYIFQEESSDSLISSYLKDFFKRSENIIISDNNIINHPDILVISPKDPRDKKYKIEDFDELFQFIGLTHFQMKWRYIILKNAELLSNTISNKLLKVFEEPPKNTTFFLTCSQDASLLETVESRALKIRVPSTKTTKNPTSFKALLSQLNHKETSPFTEKESQNLLRLIEDQDTNLNDFKMFFNKAKNKKEIEKYIRKLVIAHEMEQDDSSDFFTKDNILDLIKLNTLSKTYHNSPVYMLSLFLSSFHNS